MQSLKKDEEGTLFYSHIIYFSSNSLEYFGVLARLYKPEKFIFFCDYTASLEPVVSNYNC